MKDPTTAAEWLDAVEWAETLLAVESARQYGLITGGPNVDVARCESILAQGHARGIVPRSAGVDERIAALVEPRGHDTETRRRCSMTADEDKRRP